MAPSPRRHRRRLVRLTVATALLVISAPGVVLALVTGSSAVAAAVAVGVWLAFAVALRIVRTEIVQTRQAAARHGAAQARATAELLGERGRCHRQERETWTTLLTEARREVRELESTLRLSERRAYDAEQRARQAWTRLTASEQRVEALEVALEIRAAEEADELALWEGGEDEDKGEIYPGYTDTDTVVDLMSWEDRNHSQAAQAAWQRRRQA